MRAKNASGWKGPQWALWSNPPAPAGPSWGPLPGMRLEGSRLSSARGPARPARPAPRGAAEGEGGRTAAGSAHDGGASASPARRKRRGRRRKLWCASRSPARAAGPLAAAGLEPPAGWVSAASARERTDGRTVGGRVAFSPLQCALAARPRFASPAGNGRRAEVGVTCRHAGAVQAW